MDDERIWSNLPDDLLLNILARLHPLRFLKFRSVCKRWNRLPLDPTFIHLHSHLSHPRSGFLLTKAPLSTGSLICVDACSCTLLILPLGLPELLSSDSRHSFLFCRASAAGLLCCSHGNCFYVCNPVTRVWKKLPAASGLLEASQVGLLYDPTASNFQLLLVGCQRSSKIAQVYDSTWNRWKQVPVPGGTPSIPPLFFLCSGKIFGLVDPFTRRMLLVFDPRHESWIRIEAPWPESCFACHLWGWQGHVMLVGELAGVSLGVWQLQEDQSAWLQVTIIPDCVSMGWKSVAGDDNFICVILSRRSTGLLYDLTTKQTTWLQFHSRDDWTIVMPFVTTFSRIM